MLSKTALGLLLQSRAPFPTAWSASRVGPITSPVNVLSSSRVSNSAISAVWHTTVKEGYVRISRARHRTMLETLRYSKEPQHLVEAAKRYLKGLKGHLVQIKRQKEAKEHAARESEAAAVLQAARAPVWKMPGMSTSAMGYGLPGGY
ncbi:hypothetical protein LTR86_006212 [Recurvomyces mirabilis]|nr:hypothetical protein LTR86_006212 [Recurvomyces mirabilis]